MILTLGKFLHCEYSMTSTWFVINITIRNQLYSYTKDSKRDLKYKGGKKNENGISNWFVGDYSHGVVGK